MKNKKHKILIIFVLIAILGVLTYLSLSFLKSKQQPFSFDVPEGFSIAIPTGADYVWPDTYITVDVIDPENPTDEDLAPVNGNTKEELLIIRNNLKNGVTLSDYHLSGTTWEYDPTIEIRELEDGTKVRVSTKFAAYEACDKQLVRLIQFVAQGKIIFIQVHGNADQMHREVKKEYLVRDDMCGADPTIDLDLMSDVYSKIANGSLGSKAADNWYKASEQVINTLRIRK